MATARDALVKQICFKGKSIEAKTGSDTLKIMTKVPEIRKAKKGYLDLFSNQLIRSSTSCSTIEPKYFSSSITLTSSE
jgi:hypothetical protein